MRNLNKEVTAQVKMLARFYFRKYGKAFGTLLNQEDLEQEFWIVWNKACEKFDADKGYDFKAYLGIAIGNKAKELAAKHGRTQRAVAFSLDEETEDGDAYVDILPSNNLPVVDEIIRSQTKEVAQKNMTPMLKTLVHMIESDNPVLLAEEAALRAKADYAASKGLKYVGPKRITLTALTNLAGLSRVSRYRAIDQMMDSIK